MGHIIDLVPNHMGISKSANTWWQDVLENGPSSRYAAVFDIDWHPLKQELENKVLLPILGDSYGAVLERQEIVLEFRGGAFNARYFEHVLPIAPGTYERILSIQADTLLDEIDAHSDEGIEFLSIMTAIRHLPGRETQDPVLLAERDREKEAVKGRLAALTLRSAPVLGHIERAVALFNGVRGEPSRFENLEALLRGQAYRVATCTFAPRRSLTGGLRRQRARCLRVEDPGWSIHCMLTDAPWLKAPRRFRVTI